MYRHTLCMWNAAAAMVTPIPDFYKRLGVPETAPDAEIKAAYRRRALQCHPDLVQDERELADKEFRQISEAYQCLSNAKERQRYDAKRRRSATPTTKTSAPSTPSDEPATPGTGSRSSP